MILPDISRRCSSLAVAGATLFLGLSSITAQQTQANRGERVKENNPPPASAPVPGAPTASPKGQAVPGKSSTAEEKSPPNAQPVPPTESLPATPRGKSGIAQRKKDPKISVPAAPKDRQVAEIVVNIARDGALKVDSQVLTEKQLGQRFKDIFALNPKQAIIIRADEEKVYKNMFRVLDLCYEAGLYHVSFASRSPTPPPAP